MKSECCHQHPDNGDLATQTEDQREETDLRAINADLLAALKSIGSYMNDEERFNQQDRLEILDIMRPAIEAAKGNHD